MPDVVPPSEVNTRGRDYHFFIVSGLQGSLQEWRRLKDFIRSIVEDEQPGWTNVWPQLPTGWDYYGTVCLKTAKAAKLAFERLIRHIQPENNQPLMVHHYICSDGSDFKFVQCNCSQIYSKPGCSLPPVSRYPTGAPAPAAFAIPYAGSHYPSYSPTTGYSELTNNPYVTHTNPVMAVTNEFSNLALNRNPYSMASTYSPASADSTASAYLSARTYATAYTNYPAIQASTPSGVYAPNAHGVPVNLTDGYVQTELRSVHISKLPFGFGEEELKKLITRKLGITPEKVSLHTDHSTGKSKGSGVVSFSAAEEAQTAVNTLNKFVLKGKHKLKVRLDKNAIPISPAHAPPTIVDSSGAC